LTELLKVPASAAWHVQDLAARLQKAADEAGLHEIVESVNGLELLHAGEGVSVSREDGFHDTSLEGRI